MGKGMDWSGSEYGQFPFCLMRQWTSDFHKMRGISWLAGDLLASQERHRSMQLLLLLLLLLLHPLWPQEKRLHAPWTTDYRHIKQDRWKQTELVSALAKNATKPNPFEIILLQTTRKENNWKTEETLERAVVTLETGRIKRSNPWCLWWRLFLGKYYNLSITKWILQNSVRKWGYRC